MKCSEEYIYNGVHYRCDRNAHENERIFHNWVVIDPAKPEMKIKPANTSTLPDVDEWAV
jgi:hypothetical protein